MGISSPSNRISKADGQTNYCAGGSKIFSQVCLHRKTPLTLVPLSSVSGQSSVEEVMDGDAVSGQLTR